jgi:hypothetical protein
MSLLGKWRITAMPDYDEDYPDMVEPAYILFGKASGEGWAELHEDGFLNAEITFHNRDEIQFIARRWTISSTAC